MRLTVRQRGVLDLTPAELAAWSALEARAAEPNAFLSPHFVLPALRHLDPGVRPIAIMVERDGGSRPEMLALGVFVPVAGSRVCPVPHLAGYSSRHSYLSGLLVDRDHAHEAVRALYTHARRTVFGWQALVFPKLQSDGPTAAMLEEHARAAGLAVHRAGAQQRAVLVPAEGGQEALRAALGKKLSEIERCKRRLKDGGDVTWHCLRQKVGDAAVESFLRLEHQGWKADDGSSLRAHAADEAFFKEAVTRFDGESRALFTELRVGDRVVASTSNFVSGGAGFAFKVGWESELRKYSPGMLNEVELVRAAPEVCADLAWFDSGAAPDSFINRLWPRRRELATLVVPLTRLAGSSVRWSVRLRAIARRVRPATSAADGGTTGNAAEEP
jgi:CelD/BcsL family acetyltransferase involved in cellulose biosynthesis